MGKCLFNSGFGRVRAASYGKGAARRRLQRIRVRDNWTSEMWILVIAAILILLWVQKLAVRHDSVHDVRAHSSLNSRVP